MMVGKNCSGKKRIGVKTLSVGVRQGDKKKADESDCLWCRFII